MTRYTRRTLSYRQDMNLRSSSNFSFIDITCKFQFFGAVTNKWVILASHTPFLNFKFIINTLHVIVCFWSSSDYKKWSKLSNDTIYNLILFPQIFISFYIKLRILYIPLSSYAKYDRPSIITKNCKHFILAKFPCLNLKVFNTTSSILQCT